MGAPAAAITPAWDAEVRRALRAVTRELAGDLALRASPEAIAACVYTAYRQLSGSICAEALAEMVARLARYRLTCGDAREGPGLRPGPPDSRGRI